MNQPDVCLTFTVCYYFRQCFTQPCTVDDTVGVHSRSDIVVGEFF